MAKLKNNTIVRDAFKQLGGVTEAVVTGAVAVNGGEAFTKDDTPPAPEVLDPEQKGERQALMKLLSQWCVPLRQGFKTDEATNRAAFLKRLEAQTYTDLWKFFDIQVPGEVIDAVNRRFKDISP